jgi:hypothetical protein
LIRGLIRGLAAAWAGRRHSLCDAERARDLVSRSGTRKASEWILVSFLALGPPATAPHRHISRSLICRRRRASAGSFRSRPAGRRAACAVPRAPHPPSWRSSSPPPSMRRRRGRVAASRQRTRSPITPARPARALPLKPGIGRFRKLRRPQLAVRPSPSNVTSR